LKAHQVTAHDLISDLKPLDMIKSKKSWIWSVRTPCFSAGGLSIAFILYSILGGGTVYLAVSKFVEALSQPESHLFPLKFYLEDIQHSRNRFDEGVGGKTTASVTMRVKACTSVKCLNPTKHGIWWRL
ncbi:hypothetical protein HDU77_001743, partial [Chytriomyces hyalinus]